MKNAFLLFFALLLAIVPFGEVVGQDGNTSLSSTSCKNPSSSAAGCCNYNKRCNFNCDQYVRACVLGMVDLETRLPLVPDQQICRLDDSNISESQDFIVVCSPAHADASSMLEVDHSAYQVQHPFPYIATPNPASQLLCSGNATVGSGSTMFQPHEFLAYIGDVHIISQNNLSVGSTNTYFLSNLPPSVTISSVVVNSAFATVVGDPGDDHFTLEGQGAHPNLPVTVNLQTACSDGDVRFVIDNILVTGGTGDDGSPCAGTLNDGPLFTFNTVNSSSNTVQMNSGPWSWQLTSGSASYTTGNNGQTLNLNISGGCATFSAYNSSCGSKTYTFCLN